MASPERRLAPHEMARDSAVGRDRVLVMPNAGGAIPLDGVGSQPQTPDDINQQILEFAGLSNGVFQELREQRIAEEQQQQRERREREVMRRKENNCSANASSEVKQKLQTFLMNKKQNAATNGMTSSSPYRNWGVVKSSSGESLPAGAGVASVSSHPYKIPQPPSSIAKYDSDFPLRKTASEPNLLKIRLKQSVIERKARNGPLAARRQERLLQAAQRRQQKQQNSALATPTNCTTTPDSGPNSPPTLTNRGSPTSAPIQEENEDPNYQGNRGSINDLALFSSPSMPNISLGRPHLANAHNANNLALLSNFRTHAQLAAAAAVGAPYYTPMPPLEHHPELASHLHPSSIHHIAAQHLAMHGQVPGLYGQPITDTQVAHARLNKQGHRPLGRTQSAPLPLGHPMLTGAGTVNIGQTHYENSDAERQAMEQQHLLLTQKIRQTVLTRVGGSREPQLKEEESGEVIDLTDKKQPPKTVLTSSVITSTSQRQEDRVRDQEYLKQQRELLIRQSMHISVDDPFARGFVKPLSRTLSSPLVHLGQQPPCSIPDTGQHSLDNSPPPVNLTVPHRRSIAGGAPGPIHVTTGLAFDNQMLKHACICGDNSSHPEHSGRLQSVWARLVETGLASRCDRLRARRATQEELQTVHTEAHTMLFGTNQLNRHKLDASRVSFVRLACGGLGVDLDTTWNEHHTSAAARMAAGCVIDLALKAAKGDIRNGFAVVRPPGHHAEPDAAMGFCFFNSIAVAARLVRQRVPEMRRVLIVDWDVHHGNGTQQVFYDDPSVLYLSIHRHDDGNFFPGTGGPTECGVGPGMGFNVNVAWSGGLSPPLGDAEYLAAFRTVVMPIAREFSPDIVLVSAGFDAASGHPPPLGGYMVSPACFGHLTRELMQLAEGRVILALEGGYDLPAICDSAQECVRALLGDDLSQIADTELARPPCQNAIETIQKTIAIQMSHWPAVKRLAHTVAFSAMQALSSERDESETVTAMAGLSMQSLHRSSRDLSREDSEEPMDQDDK
ncbi:histone deacetylase 4 isoform X4 [Phlebotomus argentipes]|uniref:histone deacetylase 4 isoform X4 n=1 Tax=Phlebotomus argentipes TaxID=94469 RepID=UPI002892DDAA|nr:histone deacetylase 4 isoform X4 [Phlebotomus argentipes]